jgi:glycosyltransferase involved in cell wall biosynthesis
MITDTFPPMISGVADYTALLARELASLGLRVTIATSKWESKGNNQTTDGIEVLRIISGWKMWDARQIFRIIKRLGDSPIVHIQYGSGAYRKHPMINLLPFLIRMLKRDCLVVVTLHEFPQERERLLYRIRTLPMLLAAHGLIFVDPADEKTLRRWTKLSMARIKYIPIGSNIPPVPATDGQRRDWRRKLGLTGDVPVVAFFGGIHPFKGFLDLLEAITSLRQDNFPARLLVIGGFEPWVESTLQYQKEVRHALKNGLEAGWIRLVDKSPAETIAHCLHASDIAAFPFVNGASPNRGSILAAISQGVPVVTTEGPDTPAGFQDQFGVALVPSRDVPALSTCIRDIMMSDERRRELRDKALKASRDLSWASIAQATQEAYASLTVNRSETRQRRNRLVETGH